MRRRPSHGKNGQVNGGESPEEGSRRQCMEGTEIDSQVSWEASGSRARGEVHEKKRSKLKARKWGRAAEGSLKPRSNMEQNGRKEMASVLPSAEKEMFRKKTKMAKTARKLTKTRAKDQNESRERMRARKRGSDTKSEGQTLRERGGKMQTAMSFRTTSTEASHEC